MEDSGIDSEDKLSYQMDQSEHNVAQQSDDDDGDDELSSNLDVTFRGPNNLISTTPTIATTTTTSSKQNSIEKFTYSQPSTCRILQRKLELKVERAKRNYNQFQEENNVKKPKSSNLIPINRLQIPIYSENQPLVDYKSESDDDIEEISFFPSNKLKNTTKHELSDTFSIQEMTIESDQSDNSESQNLELLPPSSNRKFLDKLLNCFYCTNNNNNINDD